MSPRIPLVPVVSLVIAGCSIELPEDKGTSLGAGPGLLAPWDTSVWSMDGSEVFFTDGEEGEGMGSWVIRAVDIETSSTRLVMSADEYTTMFSIDGPVPSHQTASSSPSHHGWARLPSSSSRTMSS